MDKNKRFSQKISAFRGIEAPETGVLAGYAAIIHAYDLLVPTPYPLTLISDKNRQYRQEPWQVMPPRYAPNADNYSQLVFALKYEGVNLLVLKKLFEKLGPIQVQNMVQQEPLGQYSRRLWFFYEWLMPDKLNIPDLTTGNYTSAINDTLQYDIAGTRSKRQRVINNLPGTPEFCPLTRKTNKLQEYINSDLSAHAQNTLTGIRKDILLRASAFLLLMDSKASFAIEGEYPKSKKMARWGDAVAQAGTRQLTKKELIRLQRLVIENARFIKIGLRTQGGFVGEHDRSTGVPVPEHISAKWEDLDRLINGIIDTNSLLVKEKFDPVIAAAMISFGFVFIHPFADGNGRIHRYLIHHVLSTKNFAPQGMIFPISASILENIYAYQAVLRSYSRPLLDFIDWERTPDNNVKVLNETIDYYRYFDCTKQVEFLYDSVRDTIDRIIPEEVLYLTRFDQFKRYLVDTYEMPDRLVSLLVRFLEQNAGTISKRARTNEFSGLSQVEADEIERNYQEIFNSGQ